MESSFFTFGKFLQLSESLRPTFGKYATHMVFLMDINDEMINRLEETLKKNF
ncbi:MAG: hypothetical protein ABI723_03425 [Bacteroidia bacterium]